MLGRYHSCESIALCSAASYLGWQLYGEAGREQRFPLIARIMSPSVREHAQVLSGVVSAGTCHRKCERLYNVQCTYMIPH